MVAVLCAATIARANSVTIDNGVVGIGHVDFTPDDFGSFGRWVGPNDCDSFWPPNYGSADPMTNVAENLVFITAGANRGGVALTGHLLLHKLLEGAQGDGLEGDFANLTRTVTTPISLANGVATSAFAIADTGTNLRLDLTLSQRLVVDTAPVTHAEQDYTITNNGSGTVSLVWHAIWDMNCLYADVDATSDFVGVGPGLCYVYMHDPGSTTQGGAFTDGGSEIGAPGALSPLPTSGYYGAKEGVMPEDTLQPPFNVPTSTVATQHVWMNYGMPSTWVNEVAKVGKNTAGETSFSSPSAVGFEYQFALAPGQIAIIRLRRHWGTIALPCASVGANCGNGVVDSGEACDVAVDTADCNANMCTAPTCGDNYVNPAAGEQCESNGIDSLDCNGLLCTVPTCGDGYVNEAAGEECEGGALCDATTCKSQFSIGGGCAGCNAGDSGGSFALVGCVAVWLARRRRRKRSAVSA
ncbi:MAG TPA: MYXO-CTERM sorting domain-containing protein [Kofleriaceae bacterium]